MSTGPLPEAVQSLSWLIGKWKSISANGCYPTIEPFTYCEELTFTNIGQPMLNYHSSSWHPTTLTPMHLESGFLRIKPGTNQIAFIVAHNFGLTTLEEGIVEEECLKMKSKNIERISFAKEPQVLAIERKYQLIDEKLYVSIFMETSNTEMLKHLEAVYEKM